MQPYIHVRVKCAVLVIDCQVIYSMVLDMWAWPNGFAIFAATSDLQNPVVDESPIAWFVE